MRNSEMRESNMSKSSLTTDISKYPDGLMASSSRALGPDSQKGTERKGKRDSPLFGRW